MNHGGQQQISIWLYIGALLTIYGALILGAGIEELWHPPQPAVVLENLHAGIWWGGLLLVVGLVYVAIFRPGRQGRKR